jgi:hypothetical protein
MVTPKGIDALTRKSYRYFKRTIKNVVYYRESIEELVVQVKDRDFDGLVLKGVSDLDFIVEYACRKHGLPCVKEDTPAGNVFVLYSESYIPDGDTAGKGRAFLQQMLI